MLDVLIYLFEYYLSNPVASKPVHGRQVIADLRQAGFYSRAIEQAIAWLNDLERLRSLSKNKTKSSVRVFSSEESQKLNRECRGYLLFLEQARVLDSFTREVVIDRLLALEGEITIEKLKWVTLLVLFNYTTKHSEPLLLEEVLFGNGDNVVH